ncbi:MAG TPA: hypothetical protein VHF47_08225 [Acidimicrobiales bacterium]|nr:hypothetical protein [Acidimicrobiales bacterium]
MRNRRAVLFVTLVLGSWLGALTPVSPASAQDACTGTGSSSVGSPGLFYPWVGTSATTYGLSGAEVTLHPLPKLLPFSFSVSAVGICALGTFPVSTSGLISGWCGHAWGVGVTSDGLRFAWVDAGGKLIVTGGLVGTMSYTPDAIAGQSCFTGALSFLTWGTFAKLHCNLVKQKFDDLPLSFAGPVYQTSTTISFTSVSLTIAGGNYHYWTKLCAGVL